jgi:signal transduction histidine kinase
MVYALSNLATAVLFILLATFVYYRGKDNLTNKAFSLFLLSISLWSYGVYKQSLATEYDDAMFWSRVLHVGAVLIPVFFLHFSLAFANIRKPFLLSTFYLGSGFFIFLILFFNELFLREVSPILTFKYYPKAGPLYPAYLTGFFASAVMSWFFLFKAYRSSSDELRRNQVGYVLIGTLFGYAGGSTAFFLVFDVPIFPYANYGLVPLCGLLISIAIVRYRLMDIRTVIHKTAMWVVTSSLFGVPIGLVAYASKRWIDQLPLWQFLLLIGGLFVLSIPYMRLVQPKIDQLFQRRLYDLRAVLDRFIHDVAIVKSIPDLAEKLVSTIHTVLYTEPTRLLLWNGKEQQYVVAAGSPCEPIDWEDPWLQWLRGQERTVELSEIAAGSDATLAEAAKAYVSKTGAVFCLPLHRDGLLVAVVNIGPKKNLKSFTQPEREFLETLRVQASIALTNSLLYDEVKQMSEELRQWGLQLEQKVEERTKALKAAMQQLQETESQLIQSEKLAAHGLLAAGVLHEINNPLSFSRGSMSVLKRALERVREAAHGTMDPLLAEVERAAEIIQSGHDRIAAIVKDLKTFAKKDVEGLKPSDLHHGLDATVSLLRHELGNRIAVHKEYGELGLVEINTAQLNQVFLNLLQNAAQAISGYGDITIRTWKDGDMVFIAIRDTGSGISPEIQQRIFEPFFTTKPVGKGTGLGLSVSHRIVSEHGGRLSVKSAVGKGTEFLIELPVNQSIVAAGPVQG